MTTIWHSTKYPGVRHREHKNRRYNGKPDKYFVIRYKRFGKLIGESVGWASQGMNAQKANSIRGELTQNIREGKGYQSLREKREIEAESQRSKEEKKAIKEKENYTFGSAAKEYLKWSELNKKSYDADKSRFDNHLKTIKNVALKDVSPLQIEGIKSRLKKTGLSDSTIYQVLALTRAIFNKVTSWGLYNGENPVKHVKFPKLNNKRTRFLSHDESKQLLEALKDKSITVYNQSLLALHCGMRFGEIASLTWSDVDLDNGIIQIKDAKAGDRQAYITGPIEEMFNALLGKDKNKKTDMIFPDLKGNKQKHISRTFYETVKEIGFNKGIIDERNKVVYHTLRHTFASWLAMQGTSLFEIKELLGHKSISMTERYAHLMPSVKRKAVTKLADNFQLHTTKANAADVIELNNSK